jgi:hypothetical protein
MAWNPDASGKILRPTIALISASEWLVLRCPPFCPPLPNSFFWMCWHPDASGQLLMPYFAYFFLLLDGWNTDASRKVSMLTFAYVRLLNGLESRSIKTSFDVHLCISSLSGLRCI